MAPSATSPASPAPTGPDLSIPLISLTPLITPSPRTISTAQSLLSALRSFGFIYLTDAPFPPSLVPRIFSQSASFFARPQPQKDALAWTTPRANRGYVCIGREKVSQGMTKEEVAADRAYGGEDLKESYDIGRDDDDDDHNPWPDRYDEQGVEFREIMLDFFNRCQQLHTAVMRGIALGMGFDEGYFDGYVGKGDNTLRLLHYPPVAKKEFKAGRVRAGAHTDFGSVTFLFQDQRGGLQVERPGGGYIDVKPVEGAIVLNSGDLLARWSNDLIQSTKHRVVEPPRLDHEPTEAGKEEEEDVYPARYSVAYFCNPNFDRWIEALPGTYGGERGEKKHEGVNSGEYLVQRLTCTY